MSNSLFYFLSDFGVLNYQVLPSGITYNQFSNGSLLITSLDKSSAGTYTCTAQNGIRNAITKSVNVTVNGKFNNTLSYLKMNKVISNQEVGCQCDQIGRLIGLWATFQSLWYQLICPNLPHSQANFGKMSKSFIFSLKSFLGNF